MKLNTQYFIVTTFRNDLDFDNNYDNLLKEKMLLDDDNIESKIVSGTFNGVVEFSLLILNDHPKVKKHVKRIMNKYFQECYLDIYNEDAYFIDQEGIVLEHLTWLKVNRKEALKAKDFTYIHETDSFYICK